MRKGFTLSALLAVVAMLALITAVSAPSKASAASMPTYDHEDIVWGAGTASFTVPTYQNGFLLSVQTLGITNSATVTVTHLHTFASPEVLTNTVLNAGAANTLHSFVQDYVPAVTTYYVTNDVILTASSTAAKPVPLVPGDVLIFTLSATNTAGDVVIGRSTGGN